jgi:glycerol uptake facilitator-like aquaporin
MWSEARLSRVSKLLILAVAIGFVLVAGGFVAYHQANLPAPPGAPYDPNAYYQRDLQEHYATLAAGLGAILIVAAMVFLGLTGREINPAVRRALLVGGGLLLIGFALLFARPYSWAIIG